MDTAKECRFFIGDFCCSLVCENITIATSFRQYFDGFLAYDIDPDLFIYLKVVYHPLGAYQAPASLLINKEVEDNCFSFASGLLDGSINLAKKRCEIVVKEALLGGGCIRIFEQFLYQIYYTLLDSRNHEFKSFLVHASGVSRNGRGFVFAGRSGSGKSTIASLSSQDTVLNDEIVIIEERRDDFLVQSTPFNGIFKGKKNSKAPLKAVFLLEHGKENCLEAINKAVFVGKFLNEVVPPIPLLITDKTGAFSKMMDFATRLVQNVPVYNLKFLPDKSFWDCIDSEGRLC